jgi:hypothetical protein
MSLFQFSHAHPLKLLGRCGQCGLMAISWADTPLGESSAATMAHVVSSAKLIKKMMDSYVALFSYLGNSLGITLILKHPSSSGAGIGFAFL